MTVSQILFVGALLVAGAGWGSQFTSWAQLLQVQNVFSFLGVIGGVIMAKFSQSPIGRNGVK